MDLSGMSKTILLKIVGSIARSITKAKITRQISSSIARLMIYSRIWMTELTSKSSEIISKINFKGLPRRILRSFGKGRYRAIERFCNARKRSSARFLKSI
jgi:hypothetical protein